MKNIFFLDIDNTLLHPKNIFIYYNKDNIHKAYTPEEYKKLNVKLEDKKYFDYTDFRDKEIIKNSIFTSEPINKTLLLINYFIKNKDFELGVLTARGQEDVVAYSIKIWLKLYLNHDFILKRKNIFAINDFNKKYPGENDSYKKLNVLKKVNKSNKYHNIFFIDDNKHTIDVIKNYNKNKSYPKKIYTIHVDWK